MNMMNTKIERVNPEQIDETIMEEAGRLIAEGELVAFPTETVYGLGGDALHPEAARKIYAAKGRPSDNPLIVHIADFSDMERVAREVPEAARKLAGAFWPAPDDDRLEKRCRSDGNNRRNGYCRCTDAQSPGCT